jgi:hypothetical protein
MAPPAEVTECGKANSLHPDVGARAAVEKRLGGREHAIRHLKIAGVNINGDDATFFLSGKFGADFAQIDGVALAGNFVSGKSRRFR